MTPFDFILNPPTVPEWKGSVSVHTLEIQADDEEDEPTVLAQVMQEPEERLVVNSETRWE